jgi:LacI family transcriptional regulator
VLLPNYDIARQAADLLIDMAMHGKQSPPRMFKIDGPVISRGTVGRPLAASA